MLCVNVLKNFLTFILWHIEYFFHKPESDADCKEELTKEEKSAMMIALAGSCLDDVVNLVCDGGVTIETFELLQNHSTQYLKLCEIHERSRQNSRTATMWFRQRESELRSFLSLRKQFAFFVQLCRNFSNGKSTFITNFFTFKCKKEICMFFVV